jgi:hypothetical protein
MTGGENAPDRGTSGRRKRGREEKGVGILFIPPRIRRLVPDFNNDDQGNGWVE